MKHRDWIQLGKGLAFISPWIIGFSVFTVLPIVLSLYYSLCDYNLLQSPVYIGTHNYGELFGDPVFWQALGNTFKYAFLALPAGMLVSLSLALLLNAPIKGQAVYRTIVFLPSLVPAVASAMLWLWLFNSKLGLINTSIEKLNAYPVIRVPTVILTDIVLVFANLLILIVNVFLAAIDVLLGIVHLNPHWHIDLFAMLKQLVEPGWLSDTTWAMPALALMSVWGVGQTMVIYLAGLQDVPKELYEAAEIDGASPARRLFSVTLPMISPVIFFNLVMAIIGTFQNFSTPYIMTGGGPARATYFYTMYVYDNAFRYLRMGYASSMAWIQFLIIMSLTGLAFWSSKRWVHYQGK